MKQDAWSRLSERPVELVDVAVAVQGRRVLSGVTLSVEPGCMVAVTGPNGAGKSTLLRALVGLLPTEGGTVRLFGGPPRAARRRVAHLGQRQGCPAVFPARVTDLVMMGRTVHLGPLRRAGAVDRAAVDDAIARMDLTPLAGRPIQALSAGEFQRTLVARALVQRPDLLLLDEPLEGVDAASRRLIREALWESVASGAAVLVVDHGPPESLSDYDRVVRVAGGRLSEGGAG